MTVDVQAAIRAATMASRRVRFILASVFVLDILTALLVIGYGNSYLVKTLDAPASYPAFALGVYGLVKLVTAPVSGWFADHTRPATAIVATALLQGGGAAVMLLTGSAEGYIVGAGVLSAGTTLAWLLVFRGLGDAVEPDGRGSATAYLGLFSVVGLAVGFIAAALLAEWAEPESVFALGIVLAVASAALLWSSRPAPAGAHLAPPDEQHETDNAPLRLEVIAGLVVFGHFAVMNAMLAAFGPFALDLLDLSLLEVSLLLVPAVIAGGAGMFVAGRRSRHGSRLREATPLYVVGALALAFTATATNPGWFALGMAPIGLAIGGVTPLLNASRIDLSALSRAPGIVLGRLLFAEGLGSVVGPLAVGLVIEKGGVRAGAFAVAAAFAMLVLLVAVSARSVRL